MIIRQVNQVIAVGAILLFTGGCSVHPFSGSASMRIDVEVYKGPLSEEPEVQWAGLLADLREARKGLMETDNLVRAVIVNSDFKGINGMRPTGWPLPRTGVWDSEREQVRLEAYNAVEGLRLSNDQPHNLKEILKAKIDGVQVLRHPYGNDKSLDSATVDTARSSIAREVNGEIEKIARQIDHLTGPTERQKSQLRQKLDELALREIDGRLLERLCHEVASEGFLDQMKHFDCLILVTLVSDIHDLITHLNGILRGDSVQIWLTGQLPKGEPVAQEQQQQVRNEHNTEGDRPACDIVGYQHHDACNGNDIEKVRSLLTKISQFAGECRDKAFRLAIASTAGQSMNWKVRMGLVSTIVAASEYGNQLKSRADALMKQMDPRGLDRRELPPGVALRDSNATDFTQLYRWLDGATYDLVAKYVQGIGTVQDRTKIVARLFSDNYWSQINTVYASGRGKVSMALIKDDVGNWNLKSFDNDPEELLAAYKNFTTSTIKRAAEIAKGLSPVGAPEASIKAVSQLMTLANGAAFNDSRTSGQQYEMLKAAEVQLITLLIRTTEEFEVENSQLNEELAHSDLSKETKSKVLNSRHRYLDTLQKFIDAYSEAVTGTIPSLLTR